MRKETQGHYRLLDSRRAGTAYHIPFFRIVGQGCRWAITRFSLSANAFRGAFGEGRTLNENGLLRWSRVALLNGAFNPGTALSRID